MSVFGPTRTDRTPLNVTGVPRSQARRLRVAVVTESFPSGRLERSSTPGQLLEHLHRRGHDAVLICPGPKAGSRFGSLPSSVAGAPVVPVPSMSLRGHPVGLPSREVMRALAGFAPDVVHLDSPLLLGAAALAAAGQLGLPTVAVRQGEPGPRGLLGRSLARRVLSADLTLELGPEEFGPRRGPASTRLRRAWAPDGEVVVGYAGVDPVQVAGTVGVPLGAGPQSVGELRDRGEFPDRAEPGVLAALDLLVIGGEDRVPDRILLAERALASGVPVIAPASAPEAEELVVRSGLDGLTHEPGDTADLARCVHALATDAHRRHWAGMAAASGAERRARQRFGDELILRYREVIGSRAAEPRPGIG